MRVDRLSADFDGFAGLLPSNERDAEMLEHLDGRSVRDWWRSVSLEWDPFEDRPLPDFMTIDESPVLSARAMEACGDLLEGRVELLDVVIDADRSWRLVNVTRVSRALDEERSLFELYSSGRTMGVYLHEFYPVALANETIFRLGYDPGSDLYVTSLFVERVAEAGLTGFAFEEVWSDEPEAVARREREREAWRRAREEGELGFGTDGIHVAHRIVPAEASEHPFVHSDPCLEKAQAKMNEFGLGPDDAPNGVFLRPLQHYNAYGTAYFAALKERLVPCASRENLEIALRDIGVDLQIDMFPTGDLP